MNQILDNNLIELSIDVYERYIEAVLEKKYNIRYSNTNLFLPMQSTECMEENLICFLSEPHDEGESVRMINVKGKDIVIELDLLSGTIYDIDSYIGIYVGMGMSKKNTKCPYFFIRGHKGLMSWMDGTYETLKKRKCFPIRILQNVHPKKINIRFEEFKPKQEDILNSLVDLSDAKLICTDGEISINRYLLSKNSSYFLTYLTKYIKNQSAKIDFPKSFIEEYMRYLIVNNIKEEILHENIEEWIYFGTFIQDFEFVKYIYEKVRNKYNKEERIYLDTIIHQYATPCQVTPLKTAI